MGNVNPLLSLGTTAATAGDAAQAAGLLGWDLVLDPLYVREYPVEGYRAVVPNGDPFPPVLGIVGEGYEITPNETLVEAVQVLGAGMGAAVFLAGQLPGARPVVAARVRQLKTGPQVWVGLTSSHDRTHPLSAHVWVTCGSVLLPSGFRPLTWRSRTVTPEMLLRAWSEILEITVGATGWRYDDRLTLQYSVTRVEQETLTRGMPTGAPLEHGLVDPDTAPLEWLRRLCDYEDHHAPVRGERGPGNRLTASVLQTQERKTLALKTLLARA